MSRVLFVSHSVQRYREPFHERVRANLAARGVLYEVAHAEADQHDLLKKDTVQLPWAHVARTRFIHVGGARLMWQPLVAKARRADLVIVGQENSLILNYLLQLGRGTVFPRIALWGHGRNFQARRPDSLSERWKRLWARRCDWWFGYTDETRRHLEALGFPPERITVFNNSVDTSGLRDMAATITDEESVAALAALGVGDGPVGVFVGALYPDKRLDFLAEAADGIHARLPGFTLVVIGGGVEMPKLAALAATRPWIVVAGPRYGSEKVALMRGSKLFLMPGLVGLAILDAAAVGLPMVTTAYPYHSPEIAYLRDGDNGVIVQEWQNADAYAQAAAALLLDEPRRQRLAAAAQATALRYTIDAMAERFSTGVLAALA